MVLATDVGVSPNQSSSSQLVIAQPDQLLKCAEPTCVAHGKKSSNPSVTGLVQACQPSSDSVEQQPSAMR